MCVCIPTPSGCNLERREIVRDITTSPLPMEKKDVAIFLVYLFYIFLACVLRGHFLYYMLAVLYFSGVRCCLYLWVLFAMKWFCHEDEPVYGWMFLLLLFGLCFVFLMIHLGVEGCMIWVLHIYLWLLLVSISQFNYPIYVHLAQGQVVVDHELFYHDTFSAYPVCVSVLHGYGQCWKILGSKLWQLSLI